VEARVEIRNMETKVVHYVPVDEETGKYVAVLPFKSDYVLTVKKEDYVYESMYIAQDDSVFEQPATVNMEIQQVQVGKSYKLNDIYYEYDSDRLTEHSLRVIEEFVIFLNENPGIHVAIHGHTDNVGGAEYNKELSERRAKSVYDYLITLGIQSGRMSYAGFGFETPVATNDTAEGRALNRRTEFVIVSK
jgi:OmpA-OmpF porin, OOP family